MAPPVLIGSSQTGSLVKVNGSTDLQIFTTHQFFITFSLAHLSALPFREPFLLISPSQLSVSPRSPIRPTYQHLQPISPSHIISCSHLSARPNHQSVSLPAPFICQPVPLISSSHFRPFFLNGSSFPSALSNRQLSPSCNWPPD